MCQVESHKGNVLNHIVGYFYQSCLPWLIVHNISKGSNLLILSANAAASVSFRVYVNNLFYNKLIIKYR